MQATCLRPSARSFYFSCYLGTGLSVPHAPFQNLADSNYDFPSTRLPISSIHRISNHRHYHPWNSLCVFVYICPDPIVLPLPPFDHHGTVPYTTICELINLLPLFFHQNIVFINCKMHCRFASPSISKHNRKREVTTVLRFAVRTDMGLQI